MRLEEMKAIAAKRTPGSWKDMAWDEDRHYSEQEEADSAFIAMAANHIDKLLAVAEAAKAHKDLDVTNLVSCRNYIGEIVLALVELEK